MAPSEPSRAHLVSATTILSLLPLFIVSLLTATISLPVVRALDNGVGRTPAMGWNSWNFFRCNINETLIREVADAMVATGLRDAGYKYVNLDDCWMEKRGPDGRIIPFKDKFPNGLKPLADYIHSLGLKFGVYSDTGNHTCEGYPGSWGYEKLDAQTYAEWGVDYLKYDYCGMEKTTVTPQVSYELMRDALNATGRPILYSLCSWGAGQPHFWGQKVGNSWRTGIDLFAIWDRQAHAKLKLPSFLQPVTSAIKQQEAYADYVGPGGFNDPDMLVVGLEGMYPYGIVQDCPEHVPGCKPGDYISRDRWGRVGGLSHTEQRSHFSFWCMLASPLILGNDPRHMSGETLGILLASEVVALNQDPLGKQARKVWSEEGGGAEVWTKPLADGRYAALLFNPGNATRDVVLSFRRDLPEASAKWGRDVPAPDGCKDKEQGCPKWAAAGECQRNPGFMLDKCPVSCPNGCPQGVTAPGPLATAIVRDAWQREDLGAFTDKWTAHLLEPHAARVVTLTFMEPEAAKTKDQQIQKGQASGAQNTHIGGGLGISGGRGGGGTGGGSLKGRQVEEETQAVEIEAEVEAEEGHGKAAKGGANEDARAEVLTAELIEVKKELEQTKAALELSKRAEKTSAATSQSVMRKLITNGKKQIRRLKKKGADDQTLDPSSLTSDPDPTGEGGGVGEEGAVDDAIAAGRADGVAGEDLEGEAEGQKATMREARLEEAWLWWDAAAGAAVAALVLAAILIVRSWPVSKDSMKIR